MFALASIIKVITKQALSPCSGGQAKIIKNPRVHGMWTVWLLKEEEYSHVNMRDIPVGTVASPPKFL